MNIPNPDQDKPFNRIIKDKDNNPVYGIRNEHSANEEIVYIPTGKSNVQYHKPEMVIDPTGCNHDFVLYDQGKREIECYTCHLATSFIVGVNVVEDKSGIKIRYNNRSYPVRIQ